MSLKKSELESLSYNNVILLPRHTEIEHRGDVNLLLKDKPYMPIYSAPMKQISEPEFIVELGQLGGFGVLHRFFNTEDDRRDAVNYLSGYPYPYGVAIGINNWNNELRFVDYAVEHGCTLVVVDVASGYIKRTLDHVRDLYEKRFFDRMNFEIMAGNVVDLIGCADLVEAGADIIRINIGTGAQCLTSKSIGIGCPPLTAIQDCAKIKALHPKVKLIADGGIYTPGDALKALVFGADGLMIGSLFGRARECHNNGKIFGMSSYELQEQMSKIKRSNEGIVTTIPDREIRPLADIFNEFTFGLRSGLSYLNCDDINDLHDIEVEYIKI